MQSDGYSLDDKRNKLEGYGDLQDIVEKFKSRKKREDKDRTKQYFVVPRQEIVSEKYNLNWGGYHENVPENIVYENPGAILHKLLVSEIGEDYDEEALADIKGGIVKELLELKKVAG
jgi:type I restriction enzyme M protein